MAISQIIQLLSGIALFLFGMKLMGDGLKSVAGSKLELILYRLSNTTLKGVLLGTGVTAVIQSSCATSVMVVGFVNSGMMKLRQAVSVILGAILGTSITGWIISLSYIEGSSGLSGILSTATLTGAVSVLGIILFMFVKKQTSNRVGMILMGFAVLMFGMSTMSGAVGTLAETELFKTLLTSLSNPLIGVFVGIGVTAVLQSASAAVGIIQALSIAGTMSFGAVLPLLMGVAIGAAVPVLISAIGAVPEGKRAALIYPIASTISVMACASVFYIANAIFNFEFLDNATDPFSIAAVNTVLRFAMVIIVLPFTEIIETLVRSLVKEKTIPGENAGPVLEDRFITHPALAVEQSRSAVIEMANNAREALEVAFGLLTDYTDAGYERVVKLEKDGDRYEDALGTYLVKLTGRELTEKQNQDVSAFLHTLSDFERLSDHALNVAESAKELHDKGIRLSDEAVRELKVMIGAVSEIVRISIESFSTGDDEEARRVEPLEELVDQLCDEMKSNHVDRLGRGICTIDQGFVFNDLLTDFERVSDHCSNIAVAMIELRSDEFDTHKYLNRIRGKNTAEFEKVFNEYKAKYSI